MTDQYYNQYTKKNNYGQYYQEGEDEYKYGSSTPVVQSDNTNFQPNYYNKNEQITSNPESPYYSPTPQNDIYNINGPNYNRNGNPNRRKKKKTRHVGLPKCRLILAYIIFSVAIIDMLIQIIFGFPNLYFMSDDFAILGLSTLYLYYIYKRKDIRNYCIGALSVIIWFCGFGIKGFGLAEIFNKKDKPLNAVSLTCFALIFIRSVCIFCYIPKLCP